jgi:peptidoglycan/LPS O-acetylase OafA/YrhL
VALAGTIRPIAERFDPRCNSVNALRLLLAALVLISHSIKLHGGQDPVGRVTGGVVDLGTMAVDGFFALSGFLIARSWHNSPSVRRFLWRRFLRIMPGFWACLLVTAAVLLPLAQLLEHGTMAGFPLTGELSVTGYVISNWGLFIQQFHVRDLMGGQAVNGSLYTLFYEFACYLGVAALGVLGVLRRRRWVVVLLAGALWLAVAADLVTMGSITADSVSRWLLLRFGAMFLAGVLLFLGSDLVPLTWPGVAAAALVLCCAVAVAGWYGVDPGSRTAYLVLAPAAIAYLVIWLGSARRLAEIGRTTDLSYGVYVYAWPVQVLLLLAGSHEWHLGLYLMASASIAAAMAFVSWRLVESPALTLKSWSPSRRGR